MDNIFLECFGSLEDPRVERTKKHLLLDVIALAICGLLSGAQTWEEVEDFGVENKKWFEKFLELPNGIPSHDTINRIFSVLDPAALQACSMDWLNRIRKLLPESIIPIDGKTLRGSKRSSSCQKAFHVINAWSCANGVCLAQLKVDSKSNEIPAVPEVLKLLYLKGAIVTLDAMGCQKSTLSDICDRGADYVVALKGNQGELHEVVKDSFELEEQSRDPSIMTAEDDIESEHGRIEERTVSVIPASKYKLSTGTGWKNLTSLVKITCKTTRGNQTRIDHRYYISSLSASDPKAILKAIRSHWQIENNLHWCLDVVFREDECRIRDENSALNFSWLRKFGLGLLKNETSFKASIRRKQRKACTSLSYLQKVIVQI